MAAISDAEAAAWTLLQAGDHAAAERLAREIVRHDPAAARVWFVLGTARQLQGDRDGAAASYEEALRVQPEMVEAWNNLGLVRQGQGRTEEAAAHYREALRLNPAFADAYHNLGIVLHDLAETDQAIVHLRQAVALRPMFAEAHHNLGHALRARGGARDALDCIDNAIILAPDRADLRLSRALLRIRMGDYERGWAEYEWRWRCADFALPNFDRPLWDGTPLAGRTILLYADHGLGDALQFVRYAPLVRQRGGRVVVLCQRPLARLLSGWAEIDQVVPQGDSLPQHDVYAPLMSLPWLFGTTVATVPGDVPYLWADEASIARWREEIATGGAFTIGITWQGNPRYGSDRSRSFRLDQLAPLAEIPGVRLVSLQHGPAAEQIGALEGRFAVLDLGNRLGDFLDIAGAMHSLDLMIAPDTAFAHLAGSLGVPTWVALSDDPDFRWLDGRDDSPWYPGHRLFRQVRPGDWDDVFGRMKTALALYLTQPRGGAINATFSGSSEPVRGPSGARAIRAR